MLNTEAMMTELLGAGVLPQSAAVSIDQYSSIVSIDPLYAGDYAREIRNRVTGAYDRILAKYLDMIADESGVISNDDYAYVESLASNIVNRNMDFIISDFKQRYTDDVASYTDASGNTKPINVGEQIDYSDYEPLDAATPVNSQQDYLEKMRRQVASLRNEEESPKQQTRDVEQRSTTQKRPATKTFEQQLQRRIKSNIREQIKDRTKVSLRDQVKQRMNKPIHQQMKEQTSKTIHQQMRSNARSASNKAFASKAKSAVTKAKASATKAKAVAKQTVSKGKAAAKAIINLVKLFLK